MIVTIHGDQASGRAIGKPTTLGGLARMAMLSRVWTHGPPVGDDIARAVHFLRARLPMAVALLSTATIGALTRPVPPGGCSWCTARFLSAASFGAWGEPADDDVHRAFLGSKCGRCRVAFETAEVADRERRHVDQLVAAGLHPAAASRIRSPEHLAAAQCPRCEQVHPHRPATVVPRRRPACSGRPGRNPPV
jgi:hypothetical protein